MKQHCPRILAFILKEKLCLLVEQDGDHENENGKLDHVWGVIGTEHGDRKNLDAGIHEKRKLDEF